MIGAKSEPDLARNSCLQFSVTGIFKKYLQIFEYFTVNPLYGWGLAAPTLVHGKGLFTCTNQSSLMLFADFSGFCFAFNNLRIDPEFEAK